MEPIEEDYLRVNISDQNFTRWTFEVRFHIATGADCDACAVAGGIDLIFEFILVFLLRSDGKLTFNRLDRSSSLCFCNCRMAQIGAAEGKQLLLLLLLLLSTRYFQYVNNLCIYFIHF